MKVFKGIAVFLAGAAVFAQSAAGLPLVKAEHGGTYECTWPGQAQKATYVLDTEEATMLVDWGTYQVAGFVNVVSSPKSIIYSVGDATGSGKIAFLPDGRVAVGTGTCRKLF